MKTETYLNPSIFYKDYPKIKRIRGLYSTLTQIKISKDKVSKGEAKILMFKWLDKTFDFNCGTIICAHPSGEPLGFPVDKPTKLLRRECHRLLDLKFHNKQKESNWLKENGFGNGHCGQMDKLACEQAIEKLNELLK